MIKESISVRQKVGENIWFAKFLSFFIIFYINLVDVFENESKVLNQ